MECKDFEPSIIQENRVLRLYRRLDKFTLDEISTIAEDIDESVLELLLLTLVQDGKLMLRNGLYLYNILLGFSYREIGIRFYCHNTNKVVYRVRKLMKRFNLANRRHLAYLAVKNHLVNVERLKEYQNV